MLRGGAVHGAAAEEPEQKGADFPSAAACADRADGAGPVGNEPADGKPGPHGLAAAGRVRLGEGGGTEIPGPAGPAGGGGPEDRRHRFRPERRGGKRHRRGVVPDGDPRRAGPGRQRPGRGADPGQRTAAHGFQRRHRRDQRRSRDGDGGMAPGRIHRAGEHAEGGPEGRPGRAGDGDLRAGHPL